MGAEDPVINILWKWSLILAITELNINSKNVEIVILTILNLC